MKNIPAVPKPVTPVLFDIVIVELQDILKAKLSWLNYSFGRCQRLVKKKDKAQYFYPGVHIKNAEYISVFPDTEYGNFSYWVIEDPQTIVSDGPQLHQMKTKFSVVFWMNLDKIFLGTTERNTEAIKYQIINLLVKDTFLKTGRITVTNVFEQAENIYKGYSIKELESQFLMHPYYGLRLEGEMIKRDIC